MIIFSIISFSELYFLLFLRCDFSTVARKTLTTTTLARVPKRENSIFARIKTEHGEEYLKHAINEDVRGTGENHVGKSHLEDPNELGIMNEFML